MPRLLSLACAVITASLATPTLAHAQDVLLTREQALREIFPEVARTTVERKPLDTPTRQQLARQLGRPIYEDAVDVTRVYDRAGTFRGYAVVTEEIGKYRPITFMVGVSPEFEVRDVAVMVYRESRGGDVKRKRFLSQYRGKTVRDPIDSNRDIINISGATISVRSMNAGVKRVLAELTLLYAGRATAAAPP
ncbi:MAG: FMN-binding protein [Chloroflexota bacterium]|nr:FMN-binding protein [Chloroflexota bacterium]